VPNTVVAFAELLIKVWVFNNMHAFCACIPCYFCYWIWFRYL